MIHYILRLTFCSAFFIAIYYVFLQNERMHRFNRFYLIFAAIGSTLIPLLNFKTESPVMVTVEQMISSSTHYVNTAVNTFDEQIPSLFSTGNIVLVIYTLVALILILRFLFFNLILIKKTKNCEFVALADATIVLINDTNSPYSYFSFIFVPKSEFDNQLIDQRIIDHERAHVLQKHSLDILFIELLISLAWFNPVFYLFRNAIRLNHEFLADESVITQHGNISKYQHLIVANTAHSNGLNLKGAMTCPFNYLKTKKRLEMMTKQKTIWRNMLIQCLLVPVMLIAIVLFSDNTFAQEMKHIVAQTEILPAQNHTESEESIQKAFDELLKPYIKEKKGRITYYGIDSATQKQLIPLYEQMSEPQKARQIVRYMPGMKERVPTKEEFESWKDPKICGVWLNGVKVNNDKLNTYEHSDIAHYFKSTLAKNAKNYGKYIYHLDARTNDNFEAYNKRLKEEPYLVFWPKKKTK